MVPPVLSLSAIILATLIIAQNTKYGIADRVPFYTTQEQSITDNKTVP